MATKERLRDRWPVLGAFGSRQTFLDNYEAVDASRDERLKSVWPFIVRRATVFHKSIKGRERISFDLEDIIVQLWAALAEKDHLWTPERGRFITFAGAVIRSELCSIRDRARTVQSPRNSCCRVKKYAADEAAGTLKPRCRKTLDDIRRTGAAVEHVGGYGNDFDQPDRHGDHVAGLIRKEEADVNRNGVRLALRQLAPEEADILTRLYGLDGREPQKSGQVARDLGKPVREIERLRESAKYRVRRILLDACHPAAMAKAG